MDPPPSFSLQPLEPLGGLRGHSRRHIELFTEVMDSLSGEFRAWVTA